MIVLIFLISDILHKFVKLKTINSRIAHINHRLAYNIRDIKMLSCRKRGPINIYHVKFISAHISALRAYMDLQ